MALVVLHFGNLYFGYKLFFLRSLLLLLLLAQLFVSVRVFSACFGYRVNERQKQKKTYKQIYNNVSHGIVSRIQSQMIYNRTAISYRQTARYTCNNWKRERTETHKKNKCTNVRLMRLFSVLSVREWRSVWVQKFVVFFGGSYYYMRIEGSETQWCSWKVQKFN